jgi:hypothetical protein
MTDAATILRELVEALDAQGPRTDGPRLTKRYMSAWAAAFAWADAQKAAPVEPLDYHCTLKCAKCGHKNYFTRRELDAEPVEPTEPIEAASRGTP